MATLYIVATPIGNLEDITLRAIETLRSADLVFAEDTRTTRKLFEKYDIKTRLESYHAQSPHAREGRIIRLLSEGKTLALVSEAGTPGISDPGSRLVARVRKELPEARIIPVPGPSALTAALSAGGLSASEFLFLGFLPHKKGRKKLFQDIAALQRTVVFYESPHRLMKTLRALDDCLSRDRRVVVAKELSKIHEEFVEGDATEVLRHFEEHGEKVRGEFVVLVEGA